MKTGDQHVGFRNAETDSACVEIAERPRNWHKFFS